MIRTEMHTIDIDLDHNGHAAPVLLRPPVVLEARGLNKQFGEGDSATPVLRNIDLQITRGEFVALVGPSGSGKSTLLSILGLLDLPTSGDVMINGQSVSQLSRKQLATVRCQTLGYVFQAFNLLAGLTVAENVMLPGLLAGRSGREQHAHAMSLLDQVGLAAKSKRTPSELSGGEQQRVAVARALFMKPDVILADEPTGNLDTNNGQRVMDALYNLNAAGQTIVLVTHDRKIADDAPRLVSLLDGEIETDSGMAHTPNNVSWLAEH
ncbi:ABC transporter ATP-binding protein [[Mycobacterium] vasticus]|uniref:ABC transporter ATP-binding protein n=1 Tax=[Mycobacterium] vasticus TaxID=2875777 RepID=A0ABU5YXE0_9MYCO|nr:ABC transporter ATP-binding protein [Mycolicibacter sp. MYC017]MEB3069797.1 ABC transporter ATP-binding protein [Mycolicibacter sp. MYC017]